MAYNRDEANRPSPEQVILALLDSPNAECFTGEGPTEEDCRCEAYGPKGECARELGHTDTAYHQGIHVSYDSGHYSEWPVGWRRPQARIAAVQDPGFGSWVEGSEEFMAGFRTALNLARHTLRGSP